MGGFICQIFSVHTNTHKHTHICTYVYVRIYVCMYVCMYMQGKAKCLYDTYMYVYIQMQNLYQLTLIPLCPSMSYILTPLRCLEVVTLSRYGLQMGNSVQYLSRTQAAARWTDIWPIGKPFDSPSGDLTIWVQCYKTFLSAIYEFS